MSRDLILGILLAAVVVCLLILFHVLHVNN